MPGRIERLSALRVGQRGKVARIGAGDAIHRRLPEMGFVRGEAVSLQKLAPLGDPMELAVKG